MAFSPRSGFSATALLNSRSASCRLPGYLCSGCFGVGSVAIVLLNIRSALCRLPGYLCSGCVGVGSFAIVLLISFSLLGRILRQVMGHRVSLWHPRLGLALPPPLCSIADLPRVGSPVTCVLDASGLALSPPFCTFSIQPLEGSSGNPPSVVHAAILAHIWLRCMVDYDGPNGLSSCRPTGLVLFPSVH